MLSCCLDREVQCTEKNRTGQDRTVEFITVSLEVVVGFNAVPVFENTRNGHGIQATDPNTKLNDKNIYVLKCC